MKTQQFTYNKLFKLADKKQLILPNFQRDYVWKPEAQEHLLASFIVNLPIGTFLLLEGNGGEYSSRPLCFREDIITEESCYYLLDGQQRLSTIKNIFTDHLNINDWEDNFERLHSLLRHRWFLKVNHEPEHEDIFGFSTLKFKIESPDLYGEDKVSRLLTLEPSEVLDCIIRFKINKTVDKDKYFHPAYKLTGSEFDKQLSLAELFSKNNVIPLFDVLTEDMPILTLTLKLLAQARVGVLKEKVGKDSSLSRHYLGHLEPEIERKYQEGKSDHITKVWDRLQSQWVKHITDYFQGLFEEEIRVPMIEVNELPRATSVFEYMNKGGTPLDNFDILVAKYAKDRSNETLYEILDKAMRDEIEIVESLSEETNPILYSPEKFGIYSDDKLVKALKESFLNILSILIESNRNRQRPASIDVLTIKKEKILKMEKNEMEQNLYTATSALYRAISFLQFRCGVDNFDRFNYKLMILPIAYILQDNEKWSNKKVLDKIEYWYWASLFSGWYREKQNIRSINDIRLLYSWVYEGQQNEIIGRSEKIFQESNYCDLSTLLLDNEDQAVPSAIYNGILQYILSKKPNDFVEEEKPLKAWEVSMNKISLNDHHLIPLGSLSNSLSQSSKELRSKKGHLLNSPLNRTLISMEANNKISALNISKYLPFLNEMAKYLHEIPHVPIEEATYTLNNEYYKKFLEERFSKIKAEVSKELYKLRS